MSFKELSRITLAGISYPSEFSGRQYFYVPAGILSLASYVSKHGFKPEIIDFQLMNYENPYSPDSISDFLKSASSDIIGISVMTKDLPAVLIACGKFRELFPEKTIILGGPGPTGSAKHIMEKFPCVDFIIRGEGEITLLELLKALKDNEPLSEINGLVFRDRDKVVVNPARCRIENLDELPLPDYSLIDHRKYNIIYIPSTRGCRHFCTFCDQPALWQGREIRRSLKSLTDEIDYITKELKAKWEIAFSDNEFCADPERFEEFSRIYRENNYDFCFSMDRRVDSVDDTFLKEARKINCGLILYGVESGSEKVLREIKKGFKPDSIKPGLLASSRFMINSIASFMFSYPFETAEDFLETANLIYSMWNEKTMNFITFQIHYLSPLPRTPIFEKYKDRIVRRKVSNLMVTKRNEAQYDTIIDNDLKKAAVLPKKLDNDRDEDDPEVEKLIRENPEICSGFYIYNSPGLHVKENIIECLKILFREKVKTALFIKDDYRYLFNGRKIVAAGPADDKDVNGLYLKIDYQTLKNPQQFIEELKQTGKKQGLIEFAGHTLPENTTTGDMIFSLLESMRASGINPILLSPVKQCLFRFTVSLKMQSQFGMPSTAFKTYKLS
ncbi:MAG: B12-binding domain-containing radical SAM protein [Firmicutes bacterium]|nr:B12-binding domain-containing radical SAM protein [Bacillota bacterium]